MRAARVLRFMLERRKWTEPSPKTAFTPVGWKLYSSLSLVQFMAHGPRRDEPSALAPVGAIRLFRSAQLAAELASWAVMTRPMRQRCGRPASSARAMVSLSARVLLPYRAFIARVGMGVVGVLAVVVVAAGAGGEVEGGARSARVRGADGQSMLLSCVRTAGWFSGASQFRSHRYRRP